MHQTETSHYAAGRRPTQTHSNHNWLSNTVKGTHKMFAVWQAVSRTAVPHPKIVFAYLTSPTAFEKLMLEFVSTVQLQPASKTATRWSRRGEPHGPHPSHTREPPERRAPGCPSPNRPWCGKFALPVEIRHTGFIIRWTDGEASSKEL